MQRITGLPDEQVLAYEAQAEAALRAALEAVMDKIARRIEASAPAALLASVLVAAPGDQGDIIPPQDVPAGDGLPPGQPYVSPDDLASIPPMWQEAVAQQVLPIVAQVFLDAAGRTYAGMVEASSIAGLPSVGSLAAEQYLARAQNSFEQIGDDLWATARTELSDGFERGESIPQLAERLRASAGVTARTGVLVARTQVNEASNAGSFAVAQASGLAMQKEWIATPDIRTRPTHLAADGQRVDLNEPFIVGGYPAMYPAAPNLPPSERYSCRCSQGYILPDRAPAQVRRDDLQTQELADLPGTTTIDDLAAAQHARLQQIIDEQHAAVEQVIQDVHQQFRDRFGKAGGPGLGDLGPEAVVDPRAIRATYRQAGTLDDLRTAWQDEMRRITSRDIIVQLPPGASVLTMRQYAEGVTQMLERFPEARLRKISWWSDGTATDYARIASGGATIEFNAYWAADIHRAEYLRALRADVKGWTGPERSGWSVRGASTPQATAYHEFAHILDIETLGDGAAARALSIATRRAVVRGVGRDELIASDVSAYATKNGNELIAEAMTDVMVNGQRASAASREIYDLIVADYKARGLAVRTTTHAADVLTEEELATLFPKARESMTGPQFDSAVAEAVTGREALRAADMGVAASDAQRSAIERYASNDGLDINSDLRRNDGIVDRLSEEDRIAVRQLDLAMESSPIDFDAVVYRHTGSLESVFPDIDYERDLSGKSWVEPGFVSTSVESRGATYGSQINMRILVPKGTHGFSHAFLDSDELLLDRGLRFRVIRDHGLDEFSIRQMDVVVEPSPAVLLPKAAAVGGLNAKTVAQLRALAKERGVVVPAGARKADLVKALSEPTPSGAAAMPTLEVRTSLTAAEQTRVRTLVRRDPQIVATVQDRHGPISWSGNLSDADAAWLEQIYKRDRPFVERAAQEADIKRMIAAEAKKLGITPTQYRAREAERLKTLLDEKPIAVRVRDEAGLQDILSSGRFKTSLEGARRAQGLVVAKDRRQLGESIMGVSPDVPLTERPVYGYVAVRGVEPALSAGRKIEGLAQREGQEDILSTYGQIQVVLKPEIRARTTVTVGDSLDEVGFVRPSPIDNPTAESIGTAMRLENAITEPNWTRSRYVEAQIHGGLRREDIAEIVFPDQPSAAIVTALQQNGIPLRILRKGDAPIFPTQVVAPPVLDDKALLRVAARERNRLIESSQGTAKLLAELDELIANKATKAAIRQRLDPALIAPEQVFAGADPAIVDALRKALDTGDPAKLRSAITRAGTKAKLKPVSKAGAKATFDAETMEGVGGIEIAPGAQVTVVRRGTTLTLPDGSTMQLTRAQVTPIVPKPPPVKAVKAPVKRAPRGVTEVKLPAGQRGQDVFPVQWMIDSPAELSAAPRAVAAAEREHFAAAIRSWVYDKPKTGDAAALAQPYVNAALRGTAEMTAERQATIEALDDALAASRSTRSVTLYRGFTSGEHILPDDWQATDLTGLRWEEKGFTAATDQADFAETYAGQPDTRGFAIRFTLPRGSHGVSVRDITGGLDDEGEVLLPRGMEFHVIADRGIQGDYGVRWLDVEVRPKKVPIKATKRAPAVRAPTKAVARQAAIDEARQVGDLAAEVLELSNHGASVAALRSRITNAAARLGTPDEVRDALLELTSRTGDVLRAEALKQLEAAGITPVGAAGQVVKFDRKIHAPIPGVKTGDLVIVDRPGLTLTRDGEKIQLSKAKISAAPKPPTPIAPAGTSMVDREIALRRVAKAPIKGEPRFLGAGTQGVVKLYTTTDGVYVEKQLAEFLNPADLVKARDAEELGPMILDAFGLRGPASYSVGRRGVISEFMEGKTGAELFATWTSDERLPSLHRLLESDDGRLMGLADYVMGNSDRNLGNWLRQEGGRVAGIDHGYAFQMEDFRDVSVTPAGDFGEWLQQADRRHLTATVDVDPRDLAIVRARLEALRPRFTEASRSAWFNTMMRRLAELEKRAVGTTPRIAT